MTAASGIPLVNGILGPWSFIGTGTNARDATLDGSNNVVGFTVGHPREPDHSPCLI
jgi:hypothetical protein